VLLSATLPPALGDFARKLMRPGAAAVGFSAAQLNEPQAGGGGGDDDGNSGDQDAEAAKAAAAPEPERFEVPSQLRQAFAEVPAKLRLLALVGALRARLLRGGGGGGGTAKIVVFFSKCDSVEFHHALLTRCSSGSGSGSGGSRRSRGGGGGGGSEGEEGEEGGGVAGTLPVAPLKLHGDLPQAERTSNMLRFAQVGAAAAAAPRMLAFWRGHHTEHAPAPAPRAPLRALRQPRARAPGPARDRAMPPIPVPRPRPECCCARTSRRAA
jgi:superfamily II DNA/RNA helicase